ncbi:hypothetical protein FCV25MIE_14648 [Fagus crenata]
MSLTAKEDLRVDLSGEQGVTGGVLAAIRGTLSPATQKYGPWLRVETEHFFNHLFQRSDSGTSPSKAGRTPHMSTGHSGKGTPGKVDGLTEMKNTGPVQASPNIMPVKQGVTHSLTFTKQLEVIDRELGFNQRGIPDIAKLPYQDTDSNRMSKAGTVLSTDQLAHDGSIHSGPLSLGPTGAPSVSTAPPTKLKNPIGGSWKRMA